MRLTLLPILLLLILQVAEGTDEPLREVPASEILAKIEKGLPVEYPNAKVIGDLDLRGLNLTTKQVNRTPNEIETLGLSETKKVINSAIRINNSTFEGLLDFNNTIFNGIIDFSNSNFTNDINFRGAIFSGDANFNGAKFSSYADFFRAKFNRYANFGSATFDKDANFWNAIFSGDADFFRAIFGGNASFMGATFGGDAFFDETAFKKDLDLRFTDYDRFYIRWGCINKLIYHNTAYQLLIENFKKLGFYDDADECYCRFRIEQFLHRDPSNDTIMYLLDLGAWIFWGFGKKPLYPLLWSIFIVVLFGFIWMGIGSKGPGNVLKGLAMVWISFFIVFFGVSCLMNAIESWILLKMLLVLSIIFIILFGVFWWIMRLNVPETVIEEHIPIQGWPKNILEALIFSITVFLSGTKPFVDPPNIPILQSSSFMRKLFVIERILGALFSIMFFLALTGMVIRPI